jgi:DNA-binding CsgD family transcriptional regulator
MDPDTDNEWTTTGIADPWAGGADEGISRHLLRVLDVIDYGVLVLDRQGHVLHSNHLARLELGTGRIFLCCEQQLLGATVELSRQIEDALDQSCHGQRRLVLLKAGQHELTASFVPLSHPMETGGARVLMMLSRQSVCDNLAVRMYSRAQGVSPAEESVLIGLCAGLSVPDIARENGVAESTVRTQVKSLREKTRASSIRQLIVRVNTLPPVTPAMSLIAPLPQKPVRIFPS